MINLRTEKQQRSRFAGCLQRRQQDVRRGLMELNSIRGEIQEGLTVVPKMYGTAPLPAAMPRGQQGTSVARKIVTMERSS